MRSNDDARIGFAGRAPAGIAIGRRKLRRRGVRVETHEPALRAAARAPLAGGRPIVPLGVGVHIADSVAHLGGRPEGAGMVTVARKNAPEPAWTLREGTAAVPQLEPTPYRRHRRMRSRRREIERASLSDAFGERRRGVGLHDVGAGDCRGRRKCDDATPGAASDVHRAIPREGTTYELKTLARRRCGTRGRTRSVTCTALFHASSARGQVGNHAALLGRAPGPAFDGLAPGAFADFDGSAPVDVAQVEARVGEVDVCELGTKGKPSAEL